MKGRRSSAISNTSNRPAFSRPSARRSSSTISMISTSAQQDRQRERDAGQELAAEIGEEGGGQAHLRRPRIDSPGRRHAARREEEVQAHHHR